MRLMWTVITIKNYFNKGYNEHNQLLGIGKALMLLAVTLKLYIGDFPPEWLVYVGAMLGTYFFLFGWIWDKRKWYHLETEWSNIRNPALMRIERSIEKLKERSRNKKPK